MDLYKDLSFLPERKKVNKIEKLICNIEGKEKYVVHIKVLKQALNHGLVFKKVHRVIQLNQKDWLRAYIDMNTKLRKKAKNVFEKVFFKLMNNSVYEKTMENVGKHRRIKLVSEPNYHTTKRFPENLLATEMQKNKSKNE